MGGREDYEKSSGPCDIKCLKATLLAFNFIFILGGAVAMAVGLYTVLKKMTYVAVLGSGEYQAVVYLLIIAGALVLCTGILGCIGALQKNQKLLTFYFILLVIIFLAEFIAGVLAFVYRGQIESKLREDLKTTLNRNYNQTSFESLTTAVDLMQQDFQCCGVDEYSDWKDSAFIKLDNDLGLKTPTSCCKTPSPTCSTSDHPSNIYRVLGAAKMGCLLKLKTYFTDHLFILSITGIVVALLEILVMVLSCCLRKEIVQEESEPY